MVFAFPDLWYLRSASYGVVVSSSINSSGETSFHLPLVICLSTHFLVMLGLNGSTSSNGKYSESITASIPEFESLSRVLAAEMIEVRFRLDSGLSPAMFMVPKFPSSRMENGSEMMASISCGSKEPRTIASEYGVPVLREGEATPVLSPVLS